MDRIDRKSLTPCNSRWCASPKRLLASRSTRICSAIALLRRLQFTIPTPCALQRSYSVTAASAQRRNTIILLTVSRPAATTWTLYKRIAPHANHDRKLVIAKSHLRHLHLRRYAVDDGGLLTPVELVGFTGTAAPTPSITGVFAPRQDFGRAAPPRRIRARWLPPGP